MHSGTKGHPGGKRKEPKGEEGGRGRREVWGLDEYCKERAQRGKK